MLLYFYFCIFAHRYDKDFYTISYAHWLCHKHLEMNKQKKRKIYKTLIPILPKIIKARKAFKLWHKKQYCSTRNPYLTFISYIAVVCVWMYHFVLMEWRSIIALCLIFTFLLIAYGSFTDYTLFHIFIFYCHEAENQHHSTPVLVAYHYTLWYIVMFNLVFISHYTLDFI